MVTGSVRPRFQPSWTLSDKMLALAATAAVLLLLGAVPFVWDRLPEQIPSHYNSTGQPDAWGGKGAIVVPSALGLLVYAVLMSLARVPHLYNYPVPITSENAEAQYRLGRKLLLVINAFFTWLLVGLFVNGFLVALGRQSGLSPLLLIPLYVAPFCILMGYLIFAGRGGLTKAAR